MYAASDLIRTRLRKGHLEAIARRLHAFVIRIAIRAHHVDIVINIVFVFEDDRISRVYSDGWHGELLICLGD